MSDAVDIMNAAHNRTIGYPSAPAQGIACRKCMVQHAHFCQASTYDLTMDEPKDYPLCSPCAQSKPCNGGSLTAVVHYQPDAPAPVEKLPPRIVTNHAKRGRPKLDPHVRMCIWQESNDRPAKEVAKHYGVNLSTVYDIRLEKKMNKIDQAAQDLPPAYELKAEDIQYPTAGIGGYDPSNPEQAIGREPFRRPTPEPTAAKGTDVSFTVTGTRKERFATVTFEPENHSTVSRKMVKLKSGGVDAGISLSLTFNLFALNTEDRAFVGELIDRLKTYEGAAE